MKDENLNEALISWLELFDGKYTLLRIDIPTRPFMATYEFLDNAITNIHNSTKEEQYNPPYFKYWYDMVYDWYFKKYGAALKNDKKNDFIKSFIIINNMSYLINIPKNIIEKKNNKEYWLMYPNHTQDNENVLEWINNPPNISNEMKVDIINNIKSKADRLRNININLMTTNLENEECNNMLKSIFNQLESLTEDVIHSQNKLFSDSIWQVSLAVEKILKVCTYSKKKNFKRIHDLEKLLNDYLLFFPEAKIDPICYLPHKNDSINYRYGTITIDNIELAEKIYFEAISIIDTALSLIERKIKMNNVRMLIKNPYYNG